MASNISASKIFTEAGKAIGIAVAVNSVLFFLFFWAKLIDPHIGAGPENQPINIIAVVMSTAMSMLVATLLFFLLSRISSNPVKIFGWVCAIMFVITLANPFLKIKDVPTGMGIALDLLHIAPAYLIWRFLSRTAA